MAVSDWREVVKSRLKCFDRDCGNALLLRIRFELLFIIFFLKKEKVTSKRQANYKINDTVVEI